MVEQKQEAASDSEAGFDERLERLEALVSEMEEGGLSLEAAIGRYQEGVGLLKSCHETLAGYREQVQELTRGAEEALRPYAGDPDAAGSAGELA